MELGDIPSRLAPEIRGRHAIRRSDFIFPQLNCKILCREPSFEVH